MEVIVPIGYAFFSREKYNKLQNKLTFKRKEILYKKDKWKISKLSVMQSTNISKLTGVSFSDRCTKHRWSALN
jgi:hypothetical protein